MNAAGLIERIWYPPRGRRGLLSLLLTPPAAACAAAVALRNACYRRRLAAVHELPVPCVSVGNVVVGGTGKTPAVSWLVAAIEAAGRRPGVVSRGYGGTVRSPERVEPGAGAAAVRRWGDEPVMLAGRHPRVPVVAGRDRVAAALVAVRDFGAEVIVADDAFQHRRLARDLDLVLVDARRLFGSGRLLPAGPLREPPSALARAQVVVVTRIDETADPGRARRQAARAAPASWLVEATVTGSGWRALRGDGTAPPPGPVYGFCGIAHPGSFRRGVESSGLGLCGWDSFADHHRYDRAELEAISRAAAAAGAAAVVTTEKDAVRIDRWPGGLPLFVREARLCVTAGEEVLAAALRGAGILPVPGGGEGERA